MCALSPDDSESRNRKADMWVLKDKEVDAVLAADGKRRFEYFIHRVCDSRKVWGLYQEGWASLGDGETKLMPLWPHQAFAARFITGQWAEYEPRAIELDEFLQRWIPLMESEGIEPAVFPNLAGSAVLVSTADLETQLRRELEECYGRDD